MSEDYVASLDEPNSEDLETPRPNLWDGPASTWQKITEQERGLAVSLDELRARDLSIHLYNAHALKKRAAKLREKPANSVKIENPINADQDDPFIPPKSWTAWPLPPDEVPREGETPGEDDPDEIYTFKLKQRDYPSRVLEEVLTGITLKFARRTFESREWAIEDSTEVKQDVDDDSEVDGPNNANSEEEESKNAEDTMGRATLSADTFLRPDFSIDDERSAELLKPTVRHTLTKLDGILMALHHARRTCQRYSVQSISSGDEETIVKDQKDVTNPPKKHVGRPQKLGTLTHRLKENSVPDNEDNKVHGILRPKKPGRGRMPKQYPRLENETEREYLVRIARIQKKPLPRFSSEPEDPAPQVIPEKPQKPPVKILTPPKASQVNPNKVATKRLGRFGLRDWSEVLGSAALIGFPPDVIARATQRCANLFGESMSMRTMVEASQAADNSEVLATYQPEEIPNFGPESDTGNEILEDDSDEIPESNTERKSLQHPPNTLHTQVYFCSVNSCPRKAEGFSYWRLKRHVKKIHGLTMKEAEELIDPSDEEMDGAVHIDGFMRPLKRTFRGRDKGQRKKYQKRGSDTSRKVPENEPETSGTTEETNSEEGEEGVGSISS